MKKQTSILLIPILGFAARMLAPELYRLAGERERPVLAGGFSVCIDGSVLLVFAASSPWLPYI